jgi:hypothetical protein
MLSYFAEFSGRLATASKSRGKSASFKKRELLKMTKTMDSGLLSTSKKQDKQKKA